MNDIEFFNNFSFAELNFRGTRHTDNSHGVDRHYIAYMRRGRGLLTTGDHSLDVKTGDMFYIPKGLKYRSYWTGENEGEGAVSFDSIGFFYFPDANGSGYKLQKINYTKEIFDIYKPLHESKKVCAASIGSLYSFIGAIEGSLEKSVSNKASDIIQRILMLMEKDHTKSIPEYAKICGVSESLVYLYFKEVAGETPNEARQRIACQKAIKLLTTSTLSVEEICDRLAFSSSSYFRKMLFKETGKTPREIRRQSEIL